jgi:uncharacterized protein (TIGR00369 family)
MSEDDARERAQAVLEAVPFHRAVLRPRVVAADPAAGTLDVALEPSPDFRRSDDAPDILGGVLAGLIDVAAYNAVALHLDRATPTLDLRIDYLRPAVPPLVARARVLRAGRRTATVDVTVENADGRPVGVGRGSFAVVG